MIKPKDSRNIIIINVTIEMSPKADKHKIRQQQMWHAEKQNMNWGIIMYVLSCCFKYDDNTKRRSDTQECFKLLICWFNPDSKMLNVLDYSEPAGLYRRNICTILLWMIIHFSSASLMFLESGLLTFNSYTWRHVGKPAQTSGQHVAQFTQSDRMKLWSSTESVKFRCTSVLSHPHWTEKKPSVLNWTLEVDCICSLGN